MKLSRAVAVAHVKQLIAEIDDEDSIAKLATCVGAAMSFCAEPETFPVFLAYFASSCTDEQATKLRQLDHETFAEFIQYALAKLDPDGLVELLVRGINEYAEKTYGISADSLPEVRDARS